MPQAPDSEPSLTRFLFNWWKENCDAYGFFPTLRAFLNAVWDFARESTPARQKQMYGDAGYDWDYRVNTTSAAVGWRTRLLGCLHSGYQPTDLALFHEMMDRLEIDFSEFTFIDIGSGKGRALLMAAEYPFQRIVGVELMPELHAVALDNLRRYKSGSQRCFAIETICGDATEYQFPGCPMIIYLFNPLPELGLAKVMANLSQSIQQSLRPAYIVYHNPLLSRVIENNAAFRKITATHLWSIYRSG